MARMPKLNDFTFAQLQELQKRVELALAERRAEEEKALRDEMAALAAKSGFSVGELFGGKRGGKRGGAAVKYRHPKDSGLTWTGRGRQPNWLVAELKKGAKLETFAV